MVKFRIGDGVIVISDGHVYMTYETMFRKLGFLNPKSNDTPHNFSVSGWKDKIWTIFGIDYSDGKTYLAIRINEHELLIGNEGVELIESLNPIYEIW